MQIATFNRITATASTVLSFTAMAAVLSGYTCPVPHRCPPQVDEGSAAHIFQLAVTIFAPTFLVLLFTSDWKQSGRSTFRLLIAVAPLVIAFAALFYLER
jgi:hypothetical protein